MTATAPAAGETWSGCHGVRLRSTAGLDLGRAAGVPLADATLERGPVGDPAGEEIWRLALDVETPDGTVHAEQALWRRDDGSLLVRSDRGDGLEVDTDRTSVTVAGRDDAVMAQLVATYGLPLLLHGAPVLVVHAAACALDGRAVLVSGERGRGKSSILVGLTDAGWAPVTEDLCAIDLRGPAPVLWPGPPWVRRVHGEPGPAGAAVRFETYDKTGWDIGPRQPGEPVTLGAIVSLEAPGGNRPVCAALPRAEGVRRLAADAVWLHEGDDRGRAQFGMVTQVTGAVPTMQLQVPRDQSWLDPVPELLAAALG